MTNYIDPGTSKGCAVAAFARAERVPAVCIGLGIWQPDDGFGPDNSRMWGHIPWSGPCVWEYPQLYPNELQRARSRAVRGGSGMTGGGGMAGAVRVLTAKANDLIALAAAGSACANVLGWGRGGVTQIKPAAWKKQVPKPIHHKAAWGVLTENERNLVALAWTATHGRTVRIGQTWSAQHAEADLLAYIDTACEAVARHKPPAYGAKITDLLDALCLGLSQEGRLVL